MIVDNKFKFQAQDSNLEYLYLVDLEKELHFLKKKNTFNCLYRCRLFKMFVIYLICFNFGAKI